MTEIRYNDGAAYERSMGKWSQLAGAEFLEWLAPDGGLRWLDVGCGNGAFTELIAERCSPTAVTGIDPSPAQLEFARGRRASRQAQFREGHAMAIPFPDAAFDAAVMALVIFFVPDPARGVREMTRVVRPGGTVSAYAWDILGGGFPFDAMQAEMRAMGLKPPLPPSVEASRMQAMQELWKTAGLQEVETREITVQRTFADFDDVWTSTLAAAAIKPVVVAMPPADVEQLKGRLRQRMPIGPAGTISYSARANAIKGRVGK